MSAVKRNALGELIDETERTNGWNDGTVERWATRNGDHKLTSSDISAYRTLGMPTLVPAKVLALAEGLQLSPGRVSIAVLESMGITLRVDQRSPEDAIEADETLPAATRKILLDILAGARAAESPQPPRRTRKPSRDRPEPFTND